MSRGAEEPLESDATSDPGTVREHSGHTSDAVNRRIEFVAEKSAQLIELTRGFAIDAVEGSFKMSHQTLLTQRLMIGASRPQTSDDAIFGCLKALGIPDNYLAEITSRIEAANLVLFGFEEGRDDFLYKFYLEFWDRVVEAVNQGQRAPAPLHAGYKWSAATAEPVAITRYICHPMLTGEEIRERIRRLVASTLDHRLREVAEAIMQAAMGRTAQFVYLEGEEDNAPRRSYDVNLYAADLAVADVIGELNAARDYFDIPTEKFRRLIDRLGHARLGHISGGVSRAGEDFLTIYYEAG